MTNYADTSFIFSVYFLDVHSPAASAAIKVATLPLLTTEFGEFELLNAVGLGIFRGHLNRKDANRALRCFRDDIAAGVIRVVPLPRGVFDRAGQIAQAQTPQLGTRTLDVLHVASAVMLATDGFYTFDAHQTKLAAAEGLLVH